MWKGVRVLLSIRDVSKVYRMGATEVHALRHVDVEIDRGEMVAIMGSSGSGKSTLLNILGTLDRPSSGVYTLDGQDVSVLADRELAHFRNRNIGFVFQQFNLLPRYTALANVELPMLYGGIGSAERRRRAGAALDRVGLGDRVTHQPSELSGGQQQRVAVARALASRPQIIFADEPTGNLDSRSGTEILDFMRRAVREMGQTIVMVTHDPVAASYADAALFLNDGRIVDRMDEPTAERVLDRLKAFGE
jgi:putative ABC transport system ATP-binding protein